MRAARGNFQFLGSISPCPAGGQISLLCIGGYIVQDHPYVSISFQELCQINCLTSCNLTKLFQFPTSILLRKLETHILPRKHLLIT